MFNLGGRVLFQRGVVLVLINGVWPYIQFIVALLVMQLWLISMAMMSLVSRAAPL